jgi:hypothetical protein
MPKYFAGDNRVERPSGPPPRCAQCHRRPGTITWVGEGGALAYVHGGGVRWCERCVVEAQLAHAVAMARQVPALEQQLAAIDAAEARSR